MNIYLIPSLKELENLAERADKWILQLTKVQCPACDLLHYRESVTNNLSGLDIAEYMINVQSIKKEMKSINRIFRKRIVYYPSIFLIQRGNIIQEFDLDTINDFSKRFEKWSKSIS